MSELRYLDHKGRDRTIQTEYISRVEPGRGETAVTLADENGSAAYTLTEAQAQMVARQAWAAHRKAVVNCDHCYWHDARPDREGCSALCCRMREAALNAENPVELQSYARPKPKAEDPFRSWLVWWLLRNLAFFVLCMRFQIRIDLYAVALLSVFCALWTRRLYYYYMSRGRSWADT